MLRLSCESLKESPDDPIEPEEIFVENNPDMPPKTQVLESLEILEGQGYVRLSRHIGGGPDRWGCRYRVTLYGYEEYCKSYVAEYGEIWKSIISAIVNENIHVNLDLSEKLRIDLPLVTHVIKLLEHDDFVKTSDEIGIRTAIYSVSAKLRRAIQ